MIGLVIGADIVRVNAALKTTVTTAQARAIAEEALPGEHLEYLADQSDSQTRSFARSPQ